MDKFKDAVEYLIQNPDVEKVKVKEFTENILGLSEMEQQAVIDVFKRSGKTPGSPMQYW